MKSPGDITFPQGEGKAGAAGPGLSRRRLMRLALYVAPAMLVMDVAGARRALAQSPAMFEWPDEEEYGGPFPQD